MKKKVKTIAASAIIGTSLIACFSASAGSEEAALKSNKITFFGSASSSISSSVAVPHNYHTLSYSGTVPPLLNKDGKTAYERYGDTETQAIGILSKFKDDLEAKGLSMSDVTYLRVYITPDPNKGNKQDYQGWFNAYAKFFNTKENPVKTARSTVGVDSLVNSDWLIEIEAEVNYKGK
ncbi:RidA family protein [Metabacillus litoralis]|uniref:RidA family protein n=1 Tax=Metabacillus litoralis TaxID=152268 RepID=UPI000EF5B89A|nr:RidA family protein [Metabacillus litoralis]